MNIFLWPSAHLFLRLASSRRPFSVAIPDVGSILLFCRASAGWVCTNAEFGESALAANRLLSDSDSVEYRDRTTATKIRRHQKRQKGTENDPWEGKKRRMKEQEQRRSVGGRGRLGFFMSRYLLNGRRTKITRAAGHLDTHIHSCPHHLRPIPSPSQFQMGPSDQSSYYVRPPRREKKP